MLVCSPSNVEGHQLNNICAFVWIVHATATRAHSRQVIAEEETDVRVLNYAPGPLDTDMVRGRVVRARVPACNPPPPPDLSH